jgi:hypothetical protein
LSTDRFNKFKDGIERLHGAVEARGAKIVHMTPALFDKFPIQSRLLPAGLDAYPQPYEGYDDVLETYSEWLLTKRSQGWKIIDIHGAMKKALLEKRRQNPEFTFASDGVHPNADGHITIATAMANSLGLKLDSQGLALHPRAKEVLALVRNKQQFLKHSWLTKTKHLRPGIAEGLPLETATVNAAALDRTARGVIDGTIGNDNDDPFK